VALLYNDKAVLENHHVSATFRLVRDDSHNILLHLTKDDYKCVLYVLPCDTITGVNAAGDAGDTSPNILVGGTST